MFQILVMVKSSSGRVSKADTDHFLIGPEVPNLGKDAGQGRLPLTRDVMKYFFHRKKPARDQVQASGFCHILSIQVRHTYR